MYAVQEHIRHGDHQAVRYIETDLSTGSVKDMLNSCSYLKLPTFSKDAALTSRTQEEVIAERAADAERVARELTDSGTSQIGWVEYSVMNRAHRPILQSKGWTAEQIARCGLDPEGYLR
jgi:hypothetical protein